MPISKLKYLHPPVFWQVCWHSTALPTCLMGFADKFVIPGANFHP